MPDIYMALILEPGESLNSGWALVDVVMFGPGCLVRMVTQP